MGFDFSPDTSGTIQNNLTAYWKLGEASGTRSDFIGDNDLTDVNTVGQAVGLIGNAAQFVAANSERLELNPSTSDLDTGDIDFTISAWVYLDSKPSEMVIAAKASGGSREYQLIYTGGGTDRFRFQVGLTGSVVANNFGSPSTGVFIFVVAWHDSVSDTLNIQVNNGAVDSIAFVGGPSIQSVKFVIGADSGGFAHWDGRLDEIGFWKRTLTSQERTDVYNSGSGNQPFFTTPEFQVDTGTSLITNLEAYWKLDEVSGTREDFIGTHALSDNNTVTQAASGKVNDAAQFTAANSEFLNEVDTSGLSAGDRDFSFSGWVFLDAISTGTILAKGASSELSNFEYELVFEAGPVRFKFKVSPNGSGASAVSVTANSFGAPSTGVFIFIVCWHDATANTINIQVNNGAVDSTAHTTGVFDGIEDFRIGAFTAAGGQAWGGRIDEVGRWNKVLTAQERTDLYNGGSGNRFFAITPEFQIDTSGTLTSALKAYWKLDEVSGTREDFFGANDLADNNTVTQAASGKVNDAAQFTRANSEFLSIGDNVALSFGDEPLTIAGWVYLDSKPGGGAKPIVAKNDPGTSNREYLLYFSPGDDRFVFEVSGDGSTVTFVLANTFGSPPTGQFIFIVCTHDPVTNQISISVNNGTADTASHSVGIFNGVAEFRLGAQDTGGTDFIDGRIDEVGVWRRILTAQEITDLHNGGSGQTLIIPVSSILQTITTDTSIFGTTTQTIDSDVTLLTGIFSQLITSDSEILPPPAIQTIDSDTSIKTTATQTIDSDTGVAATTTQGIASNTSIVFEVAQTIQSDTIVIVNGAELKLFKESDLSTEVGTAANPVDFLSVEAGVSLQHPDNPFVLFNDKGGTLQSVDAKEIVLSVLELNLIDELVGTSAGTASQIFTVAFPPVELLDTLTVKVNNVEWTRLDTLIGAGPTDEVYTFDFTLGQVTFGDGTQGKIPPSGNTITISYTPDTILHGKEVSEQLFLGVQSNGVIANTVTVDRERVAPLDVDTCVTLRSPIANVTGVFLNSDPNKLGTNFFTGGTFDANTGTITLGTSLPSVQDVLIDYTYQIEDDVEPTFVQIGRLTKSATLNPIPSNNGKKLNFIIIVPFSASPSSPQKIRFKLRVEFKQ